MKKELLMSFSEYNTIEHPTPYTYTLQKKNQHLYYFGSKHSYDPADKQFDLIEEFWDDFVKNTHEEKRLVLLELSLIHI